MAARTSGRQRKEVNYNQLEQELVSAGPAWARGIQKENAPQPSAAAAGPAGSKKAGKQEARHSAPAAVRGKRAGVTELPIEDASAKPSGKPAGVASGKAAPLPVPAGKQVPGLPGVVVKAAAAAGAAAAPAKPAAKSASASVKLAAPAAKPAAKSGPSGSAGRTAAAGEEAAPKGGSGSGKRKADSSSSDGEAGRPAAAAAKPATKPAPDAKRQKPAAAPTAAQPAPRSAQPAAAALGGEAAAAAAWDSEPAPGTGAEELVEHFSTNFQALQAEYSKLQALYEDLKAAKIDEEVQQLLEQQNRHVTEHGHKAAQLVEHYKAEAEQQAATAAQLGGGALVEQCHQLQADLMICQQALLDKEAESLEKERQIAGMQARLGFLERFARQYESRDKCIQTDDLPGGLSAAVQFPSLQSSGVEMLHAHAMVPEGAVGGSIYKRPKPGAHPVADTSYTMPAFSPLPANMAAAAVAHAAVGPSPRAAAAAAAFGAPLSGSDMQLTGGDATDPQQQAQQQAVPPQQPQQQQQQRRQSMQPAVGRPAAAAPAAGGRPASAQSQIAIQPAAQAAAAGGRPQPVNRRVSAPPMPTDRELHFSSSLSTGAGAQQAQQQQPQQFLLPAVPEEEQQLPVAEAEGPEEAAPSVTQSAGAGGGGGGVRSAAPTPASVPAPPRELAITALTGLEATPLRGGFYQYTDTRTGYTFQLGPASPDSAGLGSDSDEEPGAEAELCYRLVSMGSAGALLPGYMMQDIKFKASQRLNFMQIMMEALANNKRKA